MVAYVYLLILLLLPSPPSCSAQSSSHSFFFFFLSLPSPLFLLLFPLSAPPFSPFFTSFSFLSPCFSLSKIASIRLCRNLNARMVILIPIKRHNLLPSNLCCDIVRPKRHAVRDSFTCCGVALGSCVRFQAC